MDFGGRPTRRKSGPPKRPPTPSGLGGWGIHVGTHVHVDAHMLQGTHLVHTLARAHQPTDATCARLCAPFQSRRPWASPDPFLTVDNSSAYVKEIIVVTC